MQKRASWVFGVLALGLALGCEDEQSGGIVDASAIGDGAAGDLAADVVLGPGGSQAEDVAPLPNPVDVAGAPGMDAAFAPELPGFDALLPPPVLRPDAGGLGGFDTALPPRPDASAIDVRIPPPPPAINPAAIKIMPEGSSLLGGISVGCSYGAGSAAARWCAFARPGRTLSKLELWVLNTSRLPTKCDGTSPDCVRLTDNLFGGSPPVGPRFPSAHRFFGDTLVFYANTSTGASASYAGPVYAWQPGWSAPKKISLGDNAFQCTGHAAAPVAVCIENLKAIEGEPITFDLVAGTIDGAAPVMRKLAQIQPTHPVAFTSQWAAGFTSDGKYFVYSHAPSPIAPETLFVIATDKLSTAEAPTQVGTPGVHDWDIAPDFSKVFYLRDHNYNDTSPSGTLYMADFPSGANPVRLSGALVRSGSQGAVAGYDLPASRDKKLGFVALMQNYQGGRGDYRMIKNPAGSLDDAMNVLSLNDIGTIPSNSIDLRYGWYFKERNMTLNGISDSRIVNNGDPAAGCALSTNTTSTIFGAAFLENAGLTFWIDNYNQDTDSGDGMVASPTDCTSKKKKFASNVDFWFVKGDEQLLYSDDADSTMSSLRVAKVVNGELGVGTLLQARVERFYNVLPGQEAVLFRIVSTVESASGLYYLKL